MKNINKKELRGKNEYMQSKKKIIMSKRILKNSRNDY